MLEEQKRPTANSKNIRLGRVYLVRVEDVMYKAFVREVLSDAMFLAIILEPFPSEALVKERSTLKRGDKRKLPADAFLAPFTHPGLFEDNSELTYMAFMLSHQATIVHAKLAFFVHPSDDEGPDQAEYMYTFLLTDPKRLGKRSILIDVYVPTDALESEEGVHSDCVYWANTDDPQFNEFYDDFDVSEDGRWGPLDEE